MQNASKNYGIEKRFDLFGLVFLLAFEKKSHNFTNSIRFVIAQRRIEGSERESPVFAGPR